MMKYIFGIVSLLFLSCGNKEEILLPKADQTIVKEVIDLSPIYIFFRIEGKDTLAKVNKNNSISTTNWILNIDRRLPLRLVIPEVMKLQEKKRNGDVHKNESAQNYYSYADSIGKNLAFIPFTDVYYKMEKPFIWDSFVCFKKDGLVKINDDIYSVNELPKLNNLFIEHECEIVFSFDKNLSFGEYIQDKILIQKLVIKRKGMWINYNKEFIF